MIKARAIQWVVLGAVAFLVLAPIVPIAYQSILDRPLYDTGGVASLFNYWDVLSSPRFGRVMLDTVIFATVGTVIAVLLGAIAAFLLVRTDIPGRKWMSSIFVWPLYMSALVLALGWVIVYGPAGYVTAMLREATGLHLDWLYSLPGMAVVVGVAEAPLAFLYCSTALQASNPALEEAARIAGASPMRAARTIAIPLLRPSILYSIILIFVSSLEALSIPLILGTPVGIELFASFLYNEGLAKPNPNYGVLAAASILMIGITTLLVVIQVRLLGDARRFVTVAGKTAPLRKIRMGRGGWIVGAGLCTYVVVAILVPLSGVVLRSLTSVLSPVIPLVQALTWNNVLEVWNTSSMRSAVTNSLFIAGVGGALATAFIALVCYVAYRSDFPVRAPLHYLGLIPRALPAIVVSIGVFWAATVVQPLGWIQGTVWILIFTFTLRFLPLGLGAFAPVLMRYDSSLDRAARVSGASWTTMIRRILVPLSAPGLLAAYVILFAHFLREYGSAVYLTGIDTNILGVSMLQLWNKGLVGPVAVLAVIQVVLSILVMTAAKRRLGVGVHG